MSFPEILRLTDAGNVDESILQLQYIDCYVLFLSNTCQHDKSSSIAVLREKNQS